MKNPQIASQTTEKPSVDPRHQVLTKTDDQTGQEYVIQQEKLHDIVLATISIVYSMVVLIFLLWLLFDVWYKEYRLIPLLTYSVKESLNSSVFRLVAFTFIGGCLGGTIASIRSIIAWHCEVKAFGGRFIYKHLSQPWIGGTLALFIFAIVRSGIGILGGEFTPDSGMTRQALSLFSIGVLSGYGSHQVYKWIDFQVNRIFQFAAKQKVPDLKGKSMPEAEAALSKVGLKIGQVLKHKARQDEVINTVVAQNPPAGMPTEGYKEVTITIAE